jgi:hypothetical protein
MLNDARSRHRAEGAQRSPASGAKRLLLAVCLGWRCKRSGTISGACPAPRVVVHGGRPLHRSQRPGRVRASCPPWRWRRIAFSILINNVDDHLHNHGFLHVTRDQWRLSPAFGINPFPDRQRELKTWISEDTGPAASIDALMAVAPYFKLDTKAASRILAEVERTVSTWHVRGRELGMRPEELEQFADAFEHRERGVAQAIAREKRE